MCVYTVNCPLACAVVCRFSKKLLCSFAHRSGTGIENNHFLQRRNSLSGGRKQLATISLVSRVLSRETPPLRPWHNHPNQMAMEYPSVDEFVAAYLANFEQRREYGAALVADGLPFGGANGLHPAAYHYPGNAASLQQQQQQTSCPAAPPPPPGAVTCEQQGDVYMQPADQMCYQTQFLQQPADWQQQQLQLQIQQQAQQHHAPQPADLQAAATSAGAKGHPTAAKATAVRPSTGSSSSTKATQAEVSTSATGKRSSRNKSSSTRGRKAKSDARDTVAAGQPPVKAEPQDAGSFVAANLGHSMSAPPQPANPAAFSAAQLVLGSNSFSAYGQGVPAYGLPGNLSNVLLLQQQAQAASSGQQQQRAAGAQAMQVQESDEPDMSHLTVMQVSRLYVSTAVLCAGAVVCVVCLHLPLR